MDKLIPKLYREYGLYVNESRALPKSIDGLKPVERRVLLSSYMMARDKFVKSARIDGNTLGKFHPHSSSYGTIVQLVNQGFLDGQGNFGSNIGVEPTPAAAMRYTEAKLSKLIHNLSFELIDYVDWIESELDDEPEFLPTMFPLCLLGNEYTTGIGFGYKTYIPCYTITDLKNRLLFLIGKTKEKPTIKPISDCVLLSSNEEFETLLTTGKCSISVGGVFKTDNIKCKAIIKSWPPGKSFETILRKFEKELINQDIGYTDESSDDNGGTHIVFEVLKLRNRDEIFKEFVKKLKVVLTGSIPFEIIVVDHDSKNVKNSSIDEMLLQTYKMYKSVNLKMLNSNKDEINKLIAEIDLLDKMKPVLPKYFQNKDLDTTKISEEISKEINEDSQRIKDILQKYRLSRLFSVKRDIIELMEKLKIVLTSIGEIDNYVIEKYNQV